jgi:hypothetical protein
MMDARGPYDFPGRIVIFSIHKVNFICLFLSDPVGIYVGQLWKHHGPKLCISNARRPTYYINIAPARPAAHEYGWAFQLAIEPDRRRLIIGRGSRQYKSAHIRFSFVRI